MRKPCVLQFRAEECVLKALTEIAKKQGVRLSNMLYDMVVFRSMKSVLGPKFGILEKQLEKAASLNKKVGRKPGQADETPRKKRGSKKKAAEKPENSERKSIKKSLRAA